MFLYWGGSDSYIKKYIPHHALCGEGYFLLLEACSGFQTRRGDTLDDLALEDDVHNQDRHHGNHRSCHHHCPLGRILPSELAEHQRYRESLRRIEHNQWPEKVVPHSQE